MNVSVIIPVINEAANVCRAVEAAWHAGASEVIVVDGGSRDETRRLAAQCDCRLVTSDVGRGKQQNAGAALAEEPVLLFLHADNRLEPGCIEQIKSAIDAPNVVAGAFRQRIDAASRLYRLLERGNAARVRRRGIAYGDQGIFLLREVFERIGRFPEVPIMEDLILADRLRRVTRPVLLPGPIHVDARRWRRFGIVRQTLRNRALLVGYRLGVPPERLARFYPRHDRS